MSLESDNCGNYIIQEPKPMVEIDLYSVIKQKYIEREVLDKIRAEIEKEADASNRLYGISEIGLRKALKIIDKCKAESEGNHVEL